MLYLKGLLDYMLWYHLFGAASPGWWERTNRLLIKEQGRAMTGYVPGGSVPYGMPWLYLQNSRGRASDLQGPGDGLFGLPILSARAVVSVDPPSFAAP